MLDHIERERNGFEIDRSLLKATTGMLVELSTPNARGHRPMHGRLSGCAVAVHADDGMVPIATAIADAHGRAHSPRSKHHHLRTGL